MATVRSIPSYQREDHFIVDNRHHLIRCAHNRHHWWYDDERNLQHILPAEMVMDDFGNLVAIN